MAIQMNSTTVGENERVGLHSSVYAAGEVIGKTDTGEVKAGISADFVSSFTDLMQTYCDIVEGDLDEIVQASSTDAFKGVGIGDALNGFISSVTKVAKDYLAQLEAVEKTVISSVEAAYASQDTDVSSQLNVDTETVNGSKVS